MVPILGAGSSIPTSRKTTSTLKAPPQPRLRPCPHLPHSLILSFPTKTLKPPPREDEKRNANYL
jgi:hypothetical protein